MQVVDARPRPLDRLELGLVDAADEDVDFAPVLGEVARHLVGKKAPGRWAISNAPRMLLWSAMVTKSIPRRFARR